MDPIYSKGQTGGYNDVESMEKLKVSILKLHNEEIIFVGVMQYKEHEKDQIEVHDFLNYLFVCDCVGLDSTDMSMHENNNINQTTIVVHMDKEHDVENMPRSEMKNEEISRRRAIQMEKIRRCHCGRMLRKNNNHVVKT